MLEMRRGSQLDW